ncbi:MAG TPA: nitrile hydratase subunit beta [Alphaproteobacteria bacterium]|nr:nitrile hydratase subunit beta [Alphaproteobacteria bacterium]
MNGVHDMGGMHGMGPVAPEPNEPVFHARWEARALAITLAMGAWRKWNIDASRHARERIPAADYLRMSYYEKWIAGLEMLMIERGLLTRAELASGRPEPGAPHAIPPLTAGDVAAMLAKGGPATRDVPVSPRFKPGMTVRARNINPIGHTRLPRYARGKLGVIERDHGVHVFPDSNAHFRGEKPQHLYAVRFSARELWGAEASPRDAVYIDLWDDHLEPA